MTLRCDRSWLLLALALAAATALVWSDVAAAQQSQTPTELWEEYPLDPETDSQAPRRSDPQGADPSNDGAPAVGDDDRETSAPGGETFPLVPIFVALAALIILLRAVGIVANGQHVHAHALAGRLSQVPAALSGLRRIPASSPARFAGARVSLSASRRLSVLDRLRPGPGDRRVGLPFSGRGSERGDSPAAPAGPQDDHAPGDEPDSKKPRPGKPPRPAKPSKPPQAAKPPKPPQAAKPSKPPQAAKPSKPPQGVKPPKPPQGVKPLKRPQGVMPLKPPQGVKTLVPPQAAKPSEPPEAVEPPEPAQVAELALPSVHERPQESPSPPSRRRRPSTRTPAKARERRVQPRTGAAVTEKMLTCSILWRRDGPVSHFFALSSGLQDHVFVVDRSPEFEWLGGGVPPEAREAHAVLVDRLVRNGWRPLGSKGAWYRQRFERPFGAGSPESSER